MLFNRYAHFRQNGEHFGAHVLKAVHWWNREVTTLDAWAMAHIAGFVIGIIVRWQFGRIELEAGVERIDLVLDVIEYEEFSFRADVNSVANAERLHVGLSLLCSRAWIAAISFTRNRIKNVAENYQCGLSKERINVSRFRIWHENHVGFINSLPATNRRAVEHDAIFKHLFIDQADIHRNVMQFAFWVCEAEVNKLDVVVFDLFQNVIGSRHFGILFARRWSVDLVSLDRVHAGFAGTDTDNFFDIGDENLTVTNAARLGCLADSFNGAIDGFVGDDDFDFHFWKKIDDIFRATVKLGMALLSAETLGFNYSNTLQTNFLKGFLHFIELERLNDGFDLFHQRIVSALVRKWTLCPFRKYRSMNCANSIYADQIF